MSAPIDLGLALERVGACTDAREWLAGERRRRPAEGGATLRDRWDACDRGDWLLWLAARVGVDRRLVVRAAVACAREALPIYERARPGDTRVRTCLDVAEAWTRGEATIEQVREASRGAYLAADAAYAYADAAYAAYADAAYAYADAAYAAYAAAAYAAYADAAYAAYAYADAYAAAHAAAHAAHAASLAKSARIVRGIIPLSDVERGLYLAAGGVL